MSIFERIFGQNTPAPAPAPAQVTNNPAQNPPPQGTEASAKTAPNGTVPEGSSAPAKPESPLAKFEKLWETPAPSKDTPDNTNAGPTPQQMMEAASKVDFSRVIDQESLKKIVNGGEDAATALVAILNKHGQTVYGQSAVVAQKLVEKAVEQAEAKFAEKVPNLVRRQTARDSLISENPAFNDPAVSSLVEMVQNQLSTKFPNATANEIKQMAQEYFAGAAQKLVPSKSSESSTKRSKGSQEVDWDEWFKLPNPTLDESSM